jgi:hypothetical protein
MAASNRGGSITVSIIESAKIRSDLDTVRSIAAAVFREGRWPPAQGLGTASSNQHALWRRVSLRRGGVSPVLSVPLQNLKSAKSIRMARVAELLGVPDHSERADDEQLAQVAVASLADAPQLLLAAGGALLNLAIV